MKEEKKEEKQKENAQAMLLVVAFIILSLFIYNALGCNKSSTSKWDRLSEEEKQQVREAHEYWEELNKRGAE